MPLSVSSISGSYGASTHSAHKPASPPSLKRTPQQALAPTHTLAYGELNPYQTPILEFDDAVEGTTQQFIHGFLKDQVNKGFLRQFQNKNWKIQVKISYFDARPTQTPSYAISGLRNNRLEIYVENPYKQKIGRQLWQMIADRNRDPKTILKATYPDFDIDSLSQEKIEACLAETFISEPLNQIRNQYEERDRDSTSSSYEQIRWALSSTENHNLAASSLSQRLASLYPVNDDFLSPSSIGSLIQCITTGLADAANRSFSSERKALGLFQKKLSDTDGFRTLTTEEGSSGPMATLSPEMTAEDRETLFIEQAAKRLWTKPSQHTLPQVGSPVDALPESSPTSMDDYFKNILCLDSWG
jgi:hypothetical protein